MAASFLESSNEKGSDRNLRIPRYRLRLAAPVATETVVYFQAYLVLGWSWAIYIRKFLQ